MSISRAGLSLVLPKVQRAWRRKLETDWTPHDNSLLSFKFKFLKVLIVAIRQWPTDPFPFEIFLFISAPVLIMVCLDAWMKDYWNNLLPSLVRCLHRRRSAQAFVFSSTGASVRNGCTSADICIRRLGCLNVDKKEFITLNAFRPAGLDRDCPLFPFIKDHLFSPICAPHMLVFSMPSLFRN